MKHDKYKKVLEELLISAGIKINGNNPWDIKVHDERVYKRILAEGSLGLGESYMDGWWDCDAIDELLTKILKADLQKKVKGKGMLLSILKAKLFNLQSKRRAFIVGENHYDIGNDLFKKMLDKRMVYTCGYWKNAKTLDSAQEAKLDLVCRKVRLNKGMRVLDIGCGWGSFAQYAAEKYGVEVVGITISKEQVELAKKLCEGLPVEIRLQDYREINEKFDVIISLGMFEAVGPKNYRKYMEVVHRCLKDDGLFLLQTSGSPLTTILTDKWANKYIFPNGKLPSPVHITKAVEGLFVLEDWHIFPQYYYDKTLMSWHKNFQKGWKDIKHNYNERFKRMWQYFLLVSAATFRSKTNQLWQIVLSKKDK